MWYTCSVMVHGHNALALVALRSKNSRFELSEPHSASHTAHPHSANSLLFAQNMNKRKKKNTKFEFIKKISIFLTRLLLGGGDAAAAICSRFCLLSIWPMHSAWRIKVIPFVFSTVIIFFYFSSILFVHITTRRQLRYYSLTSNLSESRVWNRSFRERTNSYDFMKEHWPEVYGRFLFFFLFVCWTAFDVMWTWLFECEQATIMLDCFYLQLLLVCSWFMRVAKKVPYFSSNFLNRFERHAQTVPSSCFLLLDARWDIRRCLSSRWT